MRPCDMERVFRSIAGEINKPAIYAMVKHMDTEANNAKGITFSEFMKQATDFFNERQTLEGVERIFMLFDTENTGQLTREDLQRISNELDMYLTSE